MQAMRKALAACLVGLLLGAGLTALAANAYADGGGGGGCNPLADPSCTVIVTLPGGPGSGGGDQGAGNGGGTVEPVDSGCHNTDPTQGCNPCPATGRGIGTDGAACAAYMKNLFCSQLNPNGADPAAWQQTLQIYGCVGNTFTPLNPAVLAQQALATIHFPKPSGDRSPRQTLSYQGYPFTYVNLWTYYWFSALSNSTRGQVHA